MARKVAFLVLAFVATCLARSKHARQEKARKYSVPYPQPVAIQGVTYPDCGGSPCASHGSYHGSYPAPYPAQYPASSGHCCPTGGSSCCGSAQSPPCCITVQPYESKNITVDAPSKVMLQINVLPVKASTTAKPSGPTTAPTGGSTPTTAAGSSAASTTAASSTAAGTTASSVRDAPSGNGIQLFRARALAETNREREVHAANGLSDAPGNGETKLMLDESLNVAAQRYADKIATEKKPAHSDPASRATQGENIAVACNSVDKPLSGKMAANMWYDEVKHYNWNVPGYAAKTGHFTQAVWKGTKRVGFGRAKYFSDKGKNCYVVVARYAPRGNNKGQFPMNVIKGNYHHY